MNGIQRREELCSFSECILKLRVPCVLSQNLLFWKTGERERDGTRKRSKMHHLEAKPFNTVGWKRGLCKHIKSPTLFIFG